MPKKRENKFFTYLVVLNYLLIELRKQKNEYSCFNHISSAASEWLLLNYYSMSFFYEQEYLITT